MRLFRYRVKDAFLTPMKDMTIVRPPNSLFKDLVADTFIDSHRRLRWRLGGRSTRPASHLLRGTRVRVAPAYHR
jgi:hypothetical protein